MTRSRGILLAVGIGCLGLVVCGVIIAIGLGEGLSSLEGLFREPENVNMGVIAPANALVGEGFSVLVRVRNTANETQVLDSIDITQEYLAGIQIFAADPMFTETYEIPGYQSYTFQRAIPAGTELMVQLRARALEAGNFQGEIDICINGPGNCTTRPIQTSVNP